MFSEKLKEFIKSEEFVLVYTELDDDDKFEFGKIIACDGAFFALKSFAPKGAPDGFTVKRIDDIYEIQLKTIYTHKMSVLIKENGQAEETYVLDNRDLIQSALSYALEHECIVDVYIEDSEYCRRGFVESVKGDCLTMKQVDTYGNDDGISIIKVSDLEYISCDSVDTRSLMQLYKDKH